MAKPDSKWPTRPEVAATLGRDESSVRRYIKRRLLTPQTVEGVERFDPEEVAELAAELGEEGESPEVALFAMAVQMARQSESHSQVMIDLLQKPQAATLALLQGEIVSLRARVRELEAERADMFKTIERARSEEHERRLREQELGDKRERFRQGVGVAKELLPFLAAEYARRHGQDPRAAVEAVQSIFGAGRAPANDSSAAPDVPVDAAQTLVMAIANMSKDSVAALGQLAGPEVAASVATIRTAFVKGDRVAVADALNALVVAIRAMPASAIETLDRLVGPKISAAVAAIRNSGVQS